LKNQPKDLLALVLGTFYNIGCILPCCKNTCFMWCLLIETIK